MRALMIAATLTTLATGAQPQIVSSEVNTARLMGRIYGLTYASIQCADPHIRAEATILRARITRYFQYLERHRPAMVPISEEAARTIALAVGNIPPTDETCKTLLAALPEHQEAVALSGY